jgi:hypothetical protein
MISFIVNKKMKIPSPGVNSRVGGMDGSAVA